MKNVLPIAQKGIVCFYGFIFQLVFFFLLSLNPSIAQVTNEDAKVNISGTVSDQNGEPLLGVSIMVKGTETGVVTDEEGKYTISAAEGATLEFSYLGFESQSIPVGDQSTIDVTLQEEIAALDEVVVIGYGTQQRSDLTGSVSQVSSRDINAFPTTNVLQSLSGRAAGVQVSQTTGAPGAGLNVRIRGSNSVQGSNSPLYVVDGFSIFGINPKMLNNSDIESIGILNDGSATA